MRETSKGGKLVGQKVSPVGLRIGVNKSWQSSWYAEGKDNAKFIKNDDKIRKMLEKKLKDASVSSILIERDTKKTNVVINTAKPGVVIGHGGDEIEKMKNELTKLVNENIQISIKEVKNPDLDAALVAENIARQIEGRVSFRIAQKRAIRILLCICCCCLVAKLCPTLCNPMDCSMPGFPVLHHLPEFAQTHLH